tara:strand:- start:1520 stop:1822 length:303 start_codon:yes stop_codon:yes gene_type:complete
MEDITDKVVEFGYVNFSDQKIYILAERLMGEKCKFTHGTSKEDTSENFGRVIKIDSNETRPEVEITMRRVDNYEYIFTGRLYGTPEKLGVFFDESVRWIE